MGTVFISRLTVDIPSRHRPGHIHKAGTEIAPVERVGEGGEEWLVEVRVPDDSLEGGYWWDQLEVIAKKETEIVEVEDVESELGGG